MDIESKINKHLNEDITEGDTPSLSQLKQDPLYKKVIDAKTEKEAQEALQNLIKTRGSDAAKVLQQALKQMKG